MERLISAALISVCLFGFCQISLAGQLGPENSEGTITLKKDIQISQSQWESKEKNISIIKTKTGEERAVCRLISFAPADVNGPNIQKENLLLKAGQKLTLVPDEGSRNDGDIWSLVHGSSGFKFKLTCGYYREKNGKWAGLIGGSDLIKKVAGDYFTLELKEIPALVLDGSERPRTQGISGIGSKGRGSGMSSYGAEGPIDHGGSDEGWEGTIDRQAVRRAIRSKLNKIKSCYEPQMKLIPGLAGKIVIEFEVGEKGAVRSSKVKSTTMHNEIVESCVAEKIKNATFPEPPPGQIAVIDYPFTFGPQK